MGVFAGAWLGAAQADAATIVVNNAGVAAEESCNLEQAVAAANADVAVAGCAAGSGADQIVLPQSLEELELVEALHVTEGLTLDGGGNVLRGTGVGFVVEGEASLSIRDVTFQDGDTAVVAESDSELSLERVKLFGAANRALEVEAGASLGALDAFFHQNSSSSRGGALYCGGVCKLDRVTFANNWSSAGLGGAVAVGAGGVLESSTAPSMGTIRGA